MWRYSVSIIISLLITLLVVISLISWYFIRKYRLEINFPGDHRRNSSLGPPQHQTSREISPDLTNQETAFQGREKVFSTTLIAALKQVPPEEDWMEGREAGFVGKQLNLANQNIQYLAPLNGFDLSYQSPGKRRPSAPQMEDQPYCLRDHMNANPFATIRRAK